MADGNLVTRLLILAEDRASGALNGINKTLKTIGLTIAAVFTGRAIGGFFSDVVKGAGDIQTQFLELEARTGATADEIEQLKAKAAELGASADLAVSTKEAADAMTVLGTAGMGTEEILSSIKPVLALAQGAMISADESAGILSQTLSQFGLGADQSGRALDVLTVAAQSAYTTVPQLSEALKYVGLQASSSGLSMEQTVAWVTKLQAAGLEGSMAGTAFSAMLRELSKDSSTVSKALSAAGVETRDVGELLKLFEQDAGLADLALQTFGDEAKRGLLAAMRAGSEGIDQLTQSLRTSEGATIGAAKTMNSGWRGAMDALGDAWESLKNSLGEPLLDPIANAARKAADAISAFAQSPAWEQIKASVVTAFEGAVEAIGNFAKEVDWTALANTIAGFGERASGAIKSFGESVETIRTISTAFGLFVDVMSTGVSTIVSVFHGAVGSVWKLGDAVNSVAAAVTQFMSDIAMSDSRKAFWDDATAHFTENADHFGAKAESSFSAMHLALDKAANSGRSVQQKWAELNSTATQTAQAIDQVTKSASNTGQATQGAANLSAEFDRLRDSYTQALNAGDTAGASKIKDQLNQVHAELKSAEQQAGSTADAMGTVGDDAVASLSQTSPKVAALSAEFERLRGAYYDAFNSGDTAGANAVGEQIGAVSQALNDAMIEADAAASSLQALGDESDVTATIDVVADTAAAQEGISQLEQPAQGSITVDPDTAAAEAAINALERDTSSTHTVYVKTVETNNTGGMVGASVLRRASGGSVFSPLSGTTVPGSGNQDTVPRALPAGSYVIRKSASRANRRLIDTLLTPGERVIPPWAVRRFGPAFWSDVNNMRFPRFAAGGLVGPAPATPSQPDRDSVDINLTIGSQRVKLQGARAQAQALAGALRELSRV